MSIEIVGIGRFEDPGQATVFLECAQTSQLRDVWDKPELPFTPHVTAFDGSDVEFAIAVSEALSKCEPRFSFSPTLLLEYEIGAYGAGNPRDIFEGSGVNEFGLDSDSIDSLVPSQRIAIAGKILKSMPSL